MKTYEFDRIYKLPINDILIDETKNCRGKVALHTLSTLTKDIAINGLHQPIIVRFANVEDKTEKPLILVAGFRRTFAHKILEKTEIEGIVRDITAIDAMIVNFSENIQREDLNMLQEAHAIARMARVGFSFAEIAKRIIKPQAWVRARSMLLRLDAPLQELAAEGLLSTQNITDLYSIKDPTERMITARLIKEKRERGYTGHIRVKIKRPGEEDLKKKVAQKKERPRSEMLLLQDYLDKIHFPIGFHSRILAWAAGEISDVLIMEDIEAYCLENDLLFVKPNVLGIPNVHKS